MLDHAVESTLKSLEDFWNGREVFVQPSFREAKFLFPILSYF